MTPDERNQIIHEAKGLCWHDFSDKRVVNGYPEQLCSKCGQSWDWNCGTDTLDYSKWEHYGPMLEWAIEQEWFDTFLNAGHGLYEEGDMSVGIQPTRDMSVFYLNPLRGSTVIAEFLKERK